MQSSFPFYAPTLENSQWTTNEALYNVLLMIVGFIIIVTAIYLPVIHDGDCTGWCCDKTNQEKQTPKLNLSFAPRESKASLSEFSREKNGTGAVMVMENMFSGLATLSIPHKPIYTIAKLAAEVKSPTDLTFLRKHKFSLVTVSGKRGSAEEIYMTVYMAQTLARENGTLILNGLSDENASAFQALTNLVKNQVLDWDPANLFQHDTDVWVSATFKSINTAKSVSEYLYDIMYRHLDLSDSSVRYYVISKEREDELRKAYQTDTLFKVENVTTAFHAMVLKVLFPNISVEIVPLTVSPDPIFDSAVTFLNKFIL